MNKYQTVIDKLSKIAPGYTVVVLVDSLDETHWFVKELEPYLKASLLYANYKLYGAAQTIFLPGARKSIKFVTIDTIDMISSPFINEADVEDNLSVVYSKNLQDYIVLDLEGETSHSFDQPINMDEFMWICRVMSAERQVEGKKPTYELQGLPDKKSFELTEIQTEE